MTGEPRSHNGAEGTAARAVPALARGPVVTARRELALVAPREHAVHRDVDTVAAEKPASTGGATDARGRPVQKPSLQRLGKRAAIFGPLLVVLVFITGGSDVSTGAKLFQAVVLLAVFLPLSYLLDHAMYRVLTRRHARKLAARRDDRTSR